MARAKISPSYGVKMGGIWVVIPKWIRDMALAEKFIEPDTDEEREGLYRLTEKGKLQMYEKRS